MKKLDKSVAYDYSNLSIEQLREFGDATNIPFHQVPSRQGEVFFDKEYGRWFFVIGTDGNHISEFTDARILFSKTKEELLVVKAPEMLHFIQSFVQSFESDYVVDGEIVDNPYEWLIQEYEKAKELIKQATTLQND